MAAPRKVFRIEEMAAAQRPAQVDEAPGQVPGQAEIMHELGALRALLSGPSSRQSSGSNALQRDEAERFASKLRLIRSTITGAGHEQPGPNGSRLPGAPTTRIANELEAVMQGSEQATQKILAAAEEIDQAANTLSAALKNESGQGLAQDIRDRVIAIFEACNFQDLTSQRVAKVMASFGRIEQQIARTLDELARESAPPMHGPRLADDSGHVSQSDVDSMFAGGDVKSA
jgi:chemotaxis protein CheZ